MSDFRLFLENTQPKGFYQQAAVDDLDFGSEAKRHSMKTSTQIYLPD
jgi:hypothetical protein